MKRTILTSALTALTLASAASAINIVYDDFLEGKASWQYVDDPSSTPINETIGDFAYTAGPAFIDPSFSESESYRWTIDANSIFDFRIEALVDPTPIPGIPLPPGKVLATSIGQSVEAANFSFVATASELLTLVGISPANLFALSTTGLSGAVTLAELQSTLDPVDPSLANLLSPPAALGINPSALSLDGSFSLFGGAGSILLNGEIPDVISTTGTLSLDLALTAERLDKPSSQVPDSGSTAVLAISGLIAIVAARRKERRQG